MSAARRFSPGFWVFLAGLTCLPAPAIAQDARSIVKAAIDYWRDTSSIAVSEMIIHRPDWERRMTIRVWTRGEDRSLVRGVRTESK